MLSFMLFFFVTKLSKKHENCTYCSTVIVVQMYCTVFF